ncbi:MAG: hypothetical protein AB8B63_01095 [Granulosicoccus sp.]
MNIITVSKVAAATLSILLLSACASMQQTPAPVPTEAEAIVTPRADGSVRFDTQNEQVARLWVASEKARQDKRLAIALELIYDALEISPRNSLLWSRAAELQLDNLEAAQAENYAVKSNTFAGNRKSLLYRNWLIIEHARSMRGDLLGVRNAHKKVQQYRY